MQVFKAFCKVMNKHKSKFLIYIIIYLLIAVIISRSVQESGEMEFSKVSLKIAVDQRDQGVLGQGLVSYLKEHNQIKEMPEDREALQDAMYYQEIDYMLSIPKEFTERFVQEEGEALLEGTVVPGSSSASLIENEIQQYLNTVSMYLRAGIEMEEAVELSSQDMEQKVQVDFLEESDSKSLPVGYYFFQYVPYIFLVILILGLGSVMKTFQDKDLSARNKCSALSFFQQNMQMILGCILFTFTVFLFFIAMAFCISGDYMFSLKGVLSAVNALIFSVCAASIAWFCVQFARSDPELNVMSNVFSLSFSFLGGVFVQLDLMGEGIRKLAKFFPSYWYVIANQEIQKVESFADAGEIYTSYLMVFVFALAFFSAGLLVNRKKLKRV
ncbi:MAG: ABC transporter permease [Lachnospiraceae bacterium]|jgi:ABC-2 type transport system permease protein|nr:ABC transporter permease [Lachnospiraceae bacterium]